MTGARDADANEPGLSFLVARAEDALALGRPEVAERAAGEALALDPASEPAHAALALAMSARGRREDALGAVARGLAALPRSERLHRVHASVLCDAGRHREALAEADEALRIAPDVAGGHHLRSVALQRLGRGAEAREAATAAVALAPESAAFRAQLGDAWLDDDPAAAERCYRESLALEPHAVPLVNLGVALLRRDRRDDALLAFRSAVRLDPALAAAKRNVFAAAVPIPGGPLVVLALVVLGLASIVPLVSDLLTGTLHAWTVAAVVGPMAALGALGFWRWKIAAPRLARCDPELHALFERIAADVRANRLR